MINFRNSPFLWLALLLLISFRLSEWAVPELSFPAIISMQGLCMICMVMCLRRFRPAAQYISSIFIAILVISAGALRHHEYRSGVFKGELLEGSAYQQAVVSVREVLKNKGSSVTLNCRISQLLSADSAALPVISDQHAVVFVQTNGPVKFLPGDILRIEGWLSAVKGPMNPFAFDAREYYLTLGIRHQFYCKQENIELLGKGSFSLARMTAEWQMALSGRVKKHITPQVAQLTNALVWGDRADMDPSVRDAFADSGAMHVLSVSGMHVAIIYSMLFLLLGPPSAGPFAIRAARFAVYAAAIVLYMGLTGGCPAVIRAGLMIILYLFGKSMGWNTQIWNLLGFAAFVMLWINPYLWKNIGFQLSYLAMAGILLYAKPIIRSMTFRQRIVHLCWEITALSIAAQVFLLPVLLDQFHQFPLTFILSSIVATPAAYIVMAGAILNMVLSFLGMNFLWIALDKSGQLFIDMMQWMAGMNPLMHYSLPDQGMVLLMMMAAVFSIAIVFKWNVGKKVAWACGIALVISLGCHRASKWSHGEILVFHSPRGQLIDIVENGKCHSLLDCSLSPASVEFITRGYRCAMDVISIHHTCTGEGSVDPFREKLLAASCLWWDSHVEVAELTPCRYILVHELADIELLQYYVLQNPSSTVILPAHLDRRQRKSFVAFLEENTVAYHDIDTQGFFKIEL